MILRCTLGVACSCDTDLWVVHDLGASGSEIGWCAFGQRSDEQCYILGEGHSELFIVEPCYH